MTAVHADSYTCVPLHTHNGEGLNGKYGIPGLAHEFVAVSTDDFNHNCRGVLYVEKLYDGFPMNLQSRAWLTYQMSRRFGTRANVVGRLRHSSVRDLIGMLRDLESERPCLEVNTWEPEDMPTQAPEGRLDDTSLTMGMNY